MIHIKKAIVRSPSQRLRSVIMLRWMKGQEQIDSEEFYSSEIEKIIQDQKQKIPQG